MDVRALVRDATRVKQALVRKGDTVLAKEACKIMVPARFAERGLVELGLTTYTIGIFPIIVQDRYYANSSVIAMMRIEPTQVDRVIVEDTEYLVFVFEPGSVVFQNTNLIQTKTLIYNVFNETLSKGRLPWQLDYNDVGALFESAKQFAGARVGVDQEVVEMLVAMLSRDPQDRRLQYRHTLTSLAQVRSRPPVAIPLRSIQYAATNTVNKLAGSHFSDGVYSAINAPTERVEALDAILRR